METNPVLYRIAIINEFRNTFAFIDFRKFGIMMQVQAALISPPHKGYVEKEDRICLFVNRNQVLKTVDTKQALTALTNLLCSCPIEASREVAIHQDYLYRALGKC